MIKVNCEACGAPYDVDPRRIPASGLKMRCPGCGTTFHVHPSGATGNAQARTPKHEDLDLDLPAPKTAAQRPLAGAKSAARGQSLPDNLADDLEDPGAMPAFSFDLDMPSAKGFDLDLPAPKSAQKPAVTQPANDGFDVDLPAAKPAKPGGFAPAKPGGFSPAKPAGFAAAKPAAPVPTSAAQSAFGELDLDLPAPKGKPAAAAPSAPKGPLAPDFDLDLPAPKGKPAAAAPSAPKGPLVPDFDAGLPAPKGKPAAASPRGALTPDFEVDLPAPKGAAPRGPLVPDFSLDDALGNNSPQPAAAQAARGPLSPDFDLDLPAPKVAAKPAAAKGPLVPDFDLDLPGGSGLGAAPGGPLSSDFDLDLPAPKVAAKPAAAKASPQLDLPAARPAAAKAPEANKGSLPSLDFDLPAPQPAAAKPAASFGGFDLDLPAFKTEVKGANDTQSRPSSPSGAKSFSKPSTGGESKPAQGLGNLPKDSLALDPTPMFAGSRATGALGDLDDVHVAFRGSAAAAPQSHVDLPAPSNLPAVKRPAPAGTMMGLGQGGVGKLSKDSLDMPRGFADSGSPVVFENDDLLPAPADLPQAKPTAAKAKAEPQAAPLSAGFDLDLPAPADLPSPAPAKKKVPAGGATMLGLGTGKDILAAAAQAQAQKVAAAPAAAKPAPKSAMDDLFDEPLSKPSDSSGASSLGSFDFELDLPPPTRPAPHDASGPIELEKLSLPSAAGGGGKPTFGATMALGADDIDLGPSPGGGRGLSVPGLADDDPFRGMGRSPSNNQTIELDGMLDFGTSQRKPQAEKRGTSAFGELDFGLDDGPKTGGMPLLDARPLPQPVPQTPGFDTKAVEAELLGDDAASSTPTKKKKKRRSDGAGVPGYVWPILVVVVIGVTGVGLGMFTNHGYFGVYLVEQLLPAAGDPAQVNEAINQAERIARSDTFLDMRKSLVVLSDARNEAGLNRKLLARSLLNEALYQLRFGEDAQSAQRAVAILARVMERGADAEGLTLARAADAARRGDLTEANALLAKVPADKDPYRALVTGEVALRSGKAETALKAFQEAAQLDGGARATWGAARAAIALGKLDEAEASAKQTLGQSPVHAAALTFMAERALRSGDAKLALAYTRKATGVDKVGEQRARPSRHDRAEAYALAGQIEQQLDHPREAQAAYEASLAADPLRADSLIGSGTMLMRLGQARDALSRFESALSARPSSKPDARGKVPAIEAGVGAVQALLILERASEALPRAQALAASHPNDAEASLWLGHSFEAAEKWDEAEAAFNKSIEQLPDAFAGYVALSQLLFKRSRPEEGARVLSTATGKVKDSAEVRRMLGYSELTRNHLPEAIHQFQAALHLDDKDAGALLGLTTAQRKGGDISGAEKTLARLEQVDPSLPGVPLERGQLLESRGDYSGAADAYRKALESRPSDTDLKLRLGAALVTANRLDEAEAILPDVLKERPTSAEAEHFVGRLLFARKETAQAVQHFERSIAFDSLRAEYHLYLAWAYLEQGNLGGALTSINKALERDPNLGDARWVLGRVQLRTGAVKDALGNFQQTLKLKPGRVEALANMGDAYDQLRDLSGAIRAYQEAVKQAPENGDWWYKLGTLHLDKGSRDEARVALAEAVLRGDRLLDKPSWLADAHRLYAEVLRDSGRAGEALEHYRVFLELAPPSHPDRKEIERVIRSGAAR